MIASSAETAYATNILLGNNKELKCSDVAKINSNDYESCTIKVDNGKPIVTIIGKGKFEGMSVCEGTKTSATVTSDCYTDASCFTTVDYANCEVNNVEKCETLIEDLIGDDEYKILCHGEMMEGFTFNDVIAQVLINEMFTIEELIEDEIIYEPEKLGVSIIGYSDTCEKDVVIPNKINGKPVMAINGPSYGQPAFMDRGITSVVIPNTVESIGISAFYGNKLKTINLPSNLKYIGLRAFYVNEFEGTLDMSNLPYLKTLPMFVFANTNYRNKKLNEYGFSEIKLPSSIEEIGEIAFAGNNIENLDLSSYTNLKTIGGLAFIDNNLKILKLSPTVLVIGERAFNNNKLEDVDAYVYKRTDSDNDGIAEIDTSTVIGYGGKNKNITLPNTITTIESYSFFECDLESVIIPESVLTIGNRAFAGNNLETATIGKNVTTIDSGAFFKGVGSAYYDDESNENLTTIINKTGKVFNWGRIICESKYENESDKYTFETGTVENVIISAN